jgi:hypothetical protein
MGRYKGKRCYFCGASSVSVEHAPPQLMFKNFACDSITVPSCDAHNSSKGGYDQAIISAFLIALDNGSHRYPIEEDIGVAIETARSSFVRAKRKASSAPLLKAPSGSLVDFPNVSHLGAPVSIAEWIHMLTAALVWDAVKDRDNKLKWHETVAWSAEWLDSPEPIPFETPIARARIARNYEKKRELEALSWVNGWSSHPRPYPPIIYRFDLHFMEQHVLFRHVFYNRYSWYAQIANVGDSTRELFRTRSIERPGGRG